MEAPDNASNHSIKNAKKQCERQERSSTAYKKSYFSIHEFVSIPRTRHKARAPSSEPISRKQWLRSVHKPRQIMKIYIPNLFFLFWPSGGELKGGWSEKGERVRETRRRHSAPLHPGVCINDIIFLWFTGASTLTTPTAAQPLIFPSVCSVSRLNGEKRSRRDARWKDGGGKRR